MNPYPRRWWTLIVLCISLMVIGVDNTILNVALPTLVRDLHASTSSLQWIVDAYILVFAGTLLTGGSLGDRFGRRGALTVGLIIFGLCSAGAAFSSSAGMLIAMRALMGIGGALIMPATLSILTNVFTDPREQGRAIGVWAGIAGIGIALGPIAGGALLKHFWWGSVFLVNVPVVVVALILGRFLIPTSKDPNANGVDVVGAVTSIVGLSLLLWAIINVPQRGWADSGVLSALTAATVVLAVFVLWELRSSDPMLEIGFFRNPRFTVASLSVTLTFFAMSGTMFLLSQLLQFVLGYDALGTGYRIAPIAVVMMFLGPQVRRFNERFGPKLVLASGLSIGAVGLLILATVNESSSYALVLVGLLVMAVGVVLGMVTGTTSIMGSLPKEKAGVGSAMNDTTRQVGGALGVAVLGSMLSTGYRGALTSGTRGLGLAPPAVAEARASVGAALSLARRTGGHSGAALAHVSRSAFVHGMHLGLVVAAGCMLLGSLLSLLFLPSTTGHDDLNPTELVPGDMVADRDELVSVE